MIISTHTRKLSNVGSAASGRYTCSRHISTCTITKPGGGSRSFRGLSLACRIHSRPAAKADASAMDGREQQQAAARENAQHQRTNTTDAEESARVRATFLWPMLRRASEHVRLVSTMVKPGRRSGLDCVHVRRGLMIVDCEESSWASVGRRERGEQASFKLKLLHSPRARGVSGRRIVSRILGKSSMVEPFLSASVRPVSARLSPSQAGTCMWPWHSFSRARRGEADGRVAL